MATYTGNILKVGTETKERYQKILDFITIETIKFEQQKSPEDDIITLPMDPIFNRSFNKNTMKWKIIHLHLINPYNQTITVLQRHTPNK